MSVDVSPVNFSDSDSDSAELTDSGPGFRWISPLRMIIFTNQRHVMHMNNTRRSVKENLKFPLRVSCIRSKGI